MGNTIIMRRYAQNLQPGMIVEVNGERVAVIKVIEGYSTVVLYDGVGRVVVDYGQLIDVLGHFNP